MPILQHKPYEWKDGVKDFQKTIHVVYGYPHKLYNALCRIFLFGSDIEEKVSAFED